MIPRHPGATATIVGRGPSLLELTADDFAPGPVITLNAAILTVRTLGLPNPLYYFWKDGCLPHGLMDNDPGDHDCTLPMPQTGETFLTSLAEGRFCLEAWRNRHVIDVQTEFGIPWWTMSSPVAVEVAHAMGCADVVMLAHDAYFGDDRRVEDGALVNDPHAGYRAAAVMAQATAERHGMGIRFVSKVTA
jgi:hypothetical protein